MIPWKLLDSVQVPGGSGKLDLYKRDDEYSIRVDGRELMNSRMCGSEEALAKLACERMKKRPDPRVLIGGLGMGMTLAAALGQLGSRARVDVAELVPAVVSWNRSHLALLSRNALNDPRVSVHVVDVMLMLGNASGIFDAIILDVDNGPHSLTSNANDKLYSLAGLSASFKALRSGGVLVIWSAEPNKAFAQRLRHIGFDVEEVCARARTGSRRGGRHTIWVAARRS